MSTFRFEKDELSAISPDILKMYAVAAGWKKVGEYGKHCDIYDADGKPEIMIPRTDQLIDYARGVAELISFIARSAGTDEMSIYRDLTYARCDVIRSRVKSEGDSAPINDTIDLMSGSKSLLGAALRSLDNPKPAYQGRIGKYADVLNKIRFGQTEKGSLVIPLLTPPIEPLEPPSQEQGELIEIPKDPKAPIERRMTRRLIEALGAARDAVDQKEDDGAFERAVEKGVSSNLCEAIVKMAAPFPSLNIAVTWAKTLPIKPALSEVRFVKEDLGILEEAAAELKEQKETSDETLTGIVERLHRPEKKKRGTITLRTTLEGQRRLVGAVLEEGDYGKAIQAHDKKRLITLSGILEQTDGGRKLLNARVVGEQEALFREK